MKAAKASKSTVSRLLVLVTFLVTVGLTVQVYGQGKVTLKDVKISGNVRVEDDGIRLHLKSRPGETFDSAIVDQDVKAIFRMGFFDDVQAELSPDGVLTYAVKEKPYIREIKVQGATQVSREKVEGALGVSQRTILDRIKVAEGVDKVRKLYNDQGYVNAKVDYSVAVEPNNQAVVTLDIVEGGRLLIKKVSFEGNKAFNEGELKDQIATKEEWMFSFITNRGVLDRDVLTNDVAILSQYYNDHGYVEHKIDDPVLLRAR
ncbi:MAG TPA: POTRA domain-containing protein, partial [Candidatus Binatia bacterium]|nr:POTRA domain-containing protein [Candidatus Binatia bacterium]